ncbi:hypothetical protein DV737_g5368, partial [Chaetothyriales sp. CBS 132003]
MLALLDPGLELEIADPTAAAASPKLPAADTAFALKNQDEKDEEDGVEEGGEEEVEEDEEVIEEGEGDEDAAVPEADNV